jgi:hypothetical protein
MKRDGTQKARLCACRAARRFKASTTTRCGAALFVPASSLRMLSSLAAKEKLHMHRWDFVAAFLQGELCDKEVVYCSMPSGYNATGLDPSNPSGDDTVLRIAQPIYGMAQAGRRWQRTIFPYLVKAGFVATESDPCVFTKRETVQTPSGPREETLIISCYVDDDLFTPSTRTTTSTRSTTPSPSSSWSTGRWRTRAP